MPKSSSVINLCLNCETQLETFSSRYCDECRILKDGGAWVDEFGKLIESDLQYECRISAMLQEALMKIAEVETKFSPLQGTTYTGDVASNTLSALAVASEQRYKLKCRIETDRLRMRRGA